MTERERELLMVRLYELDQRLVAIHDLRVVDGDPAQIEASIFAEQLEIDRSLGVGFPFLVT